MKEEQPSYYSILTADIRYDKRLKNHADEKILFSEITALSNKYGFCTASNKYFAELYDRSTTTISRWINHLKKLGYLIVQMDYENNQIKQRRVYPQTDSKNSIKDDEGILTDDNTPSHSKQEGIVVADKGGILTDDKDNITSINNTSINSHDEDEPANEVFKMYSQEIGILGPTAKQFVLDSISDFEEKGNSQNEACDIVIYAMNLMVENSAKSWKYVQAILKNWLNNNLFTLDNIKASQKERQNKPKRKYGRYNQRPKETGTDWSQVKAKETANNPSDLQARLAKMRGKQDATN